MIRAVQIPTYVCGQIVLLLCYKATWLNDKQGGELHAKQGRNIALVLDYGRILGVGKVKI